MLFVPGFKQGLTETLEPIKKWYHDLGFTDEVDVKVYEVNSELLRRCGMPHLHAFAPPCIHFGYVNQDALKAFYTKTLVPILGEKYPSVSRELLPQLIWNALDYCLDGSGAPQPLLDFVAKHEGPRIYLSERMTSMIGTKRQIVLEATLAHEYLHVLQDANQQTERIPFSLEVFPFIASDLYGLSKDPDFEELDEETKTQLDFDASDDIKAQGSSATKIYTTIGQAARTTSEDTFPIFYNGDPLETKLLQFSQLALHRQVNEFLDFAIALSLVETYLAENDFIKRKDPFKL